MINMANVIVSPLFAQDITVQRSSGHFAIGGYVQDAPTTLTFKGIATHVDIQDVEMGVEADRIRELFKFYTREKIYVTHAAGTTSGTSDKVIYKGQTFRILQNHDYLDYGYNVAIGQRIEGD